VSRAVVLGRPVNGQFASDPSPWRKALVAAALPVALLAAVIVQLTVVNRLPLPGGTAPDLVLLLVTAVAVSTSPMTGLLTGFAGGLALDVAPPATHYAGEYALVFCLAGYFAARIAAAAGATSGERNPWVELGVMAAATAAGEAGKAGLGQLLSDPDVTCPAIKHVLPGAIAWDVLLAPFAFLLVTWVVRLARPVEERAPRPEFVGAQRLAAVFRLASAGAAPNLRLAGSGAKFTDDRPARRVPKLRLADARSKSFARTAPAGSGTARPALAGARTAKLNFAHSASALRSAGGPALRGRTPRLNFLHSRSAVRSASGVGHLGRTPKLNFAGKSPALTPPRSQKGPGKGWIRTGDRPGITPPRSQRGPGKGWIRSAGRSGRSGRSGRRSGSGGRAAGTGAGPGIVVAGRRSPKAGWLRTDAHRPPAAANRARPGKGWLRKSKRPRANWYSSGPSTRWVRRSRSKDRWRTRRRSLSGALLSGVRDLLPSGDRR
jgi:rod shape-determining protein MreD